MSRDHRMLAASLLGADLMRLGEEAAMAGAAGADWLHFDQMDGHFVPNISFGPDFVASMRRTTDQFLDVHLMLSHPMRYIGAYAEAGANLITVHAEAEDDPAAALKSIAEHGLRMGLAIKPATPPQAIEHLLPLCDLVLVMLVEPGFGGQSLHENCVRKLPVLREMIRGTGRRILLEVDGGVRVSNARRIQEAGADVLVMGTGFFRAEDPYAVAKAVKEGGAACGQ